MDRNDATTFVSLLYQSILGRDADPEGLRLKVEALVNGRASVVDITREFAQSREFADRVRLTKPNLCGFPEFAPQDLFVAPDVLDALFAKTATYWRNTAAKPDEMYWSVLTEGQWRRELTPDDRRRFVATGQPYAQRVLETHWKHSGRMPTNLRVLDFGCGVGRLALNFAPHVAEVCAVDFSTAHLAELQKNAQLLNVGGKVSTWHLTTPADLAPAPSVDLVYSFIALQHNTPPIIAHFVESLLQHVLPGGYAFLHVTIAHAGYEGFAPQQYLADPKAGTTMEVHFLPRKNLEQIARRAGCEIVESGCIGGTFCAYSEELVFRRPARSA